MDSITATKPKKPLLQPYVPIHRRNQQQQQQQVINNVRPSVSTMSSSSGGEEGIKRRGRGQFRAPSFNDLRQCNNNIQVECSNDNSNLNNEKMIKTDIDDSRKEKEHMEKLISKVEKLSIESSDEEKEDWEEEWELSSIAIEKKTETTSPSQESKKVDTLLNDDQTMTTVLDCYDFPSSFKTYHLQDIFKEFETMKGGYSIKWIDDTRALIIFEHPETAKKAYISLLNSQLLKIRPYKGQIQKTPSGPIPRRPVTTDMVAKRLVHNALGVRTVKTAEQRQAERELLRAAREQRAAQKANNALREKQISDAFNE